MYLITSLLIILLATVLKCVMITFWRFFDIPTSVLPSIRSSSEIYGKLVSGPLAGVPISGVCIIISMYKIILNVCTHTIWGQSYLAPFKNVFSSFFRSVWGTSSQHLLVNCVSRKVKLKIRKFVVSVLFVSIFRKW